MVASASSRPQRQKVVWSDAEKRKIVSSAVDIHEKRPDLAGLPLLRAAIAMMPAARRRKLIALSQAPWFEPGVESEVSRREAEAKASQSLAPLIRMNADANAATAAILEWFQGLHKEWRDGQSQQIAELARTLETLVKEVRSLKPVRRRYGAMRPKR